VEKVREAGHYRDVVQDEQRERVLLLDQLNVVEEMWKTSML
jgi:hypothetical protein